MKLRIGRDFSLPIEAVTETFAILAKRGVGKTYTAKRMAEQMLPQRGAKANAGGAIDVGGGALRVLKALVQRHPLTVTRRQLATLAGLAPSGGTFATYFSRLRTAGYLVENSGYLSCSVAGIAAAGVLPAQPQSAAELVAMWRDNVGCGAGRMLDALVEQYPRRIARGQLAELIGLEPSGGTFSTYLSRLRSNGLAEVNGDGVRAAETLFEMAGAAGR